eukprot:TRINITY_DN1066_c1_g1_i1.p1 TRINITY_DN1066_c1_g1~~TRINITY_DN1066_c1_g1_i1.p1  ORF type:complete len:135 (-),score=43.00 TRINITY_DN1066_c1_g1_i1:548-952(-)
MTGVEVVLLILAVLGLLSGSYFAAWWYCNGVRIEKTNHLILEDDMNGNATMRKESKLYTGLDTVDESRMLKLSAMKEVEIPLPPSAPGNVNMEEQQHYFTSYTVSQSSSANVETSTAVNNSHLPLSEPRIIMNE